MPSHWVKFTLIFIVASGLLFAGFFLAWYPHAVIEDMEARLNQGGLTQSEIANLQAGLPWWRAQGILYYVSASNFVIAAGILVLVYAIAYSVLIAWRESIRTKQTNTKRQEVKRVKLEQNETENFQYKRKRKTEYISFSAAGGLLMIITSCMVMMFSGVHVLSYILANSSQVPTQGVNTLADGVFGIVVSILALAGGVMVLKRKKLVFSIIAMCFMVVKGATFIILSGGDFWGLFIGMDILALTIMSLIFTLVSYKEFS